MEYELLPAQKEFLLNSGDYPRDIALYQGGYTCVPADTEFLSPTGWKTIDTLTKDDLLAVYYDDGTFKYEHPLEVFKWAADFWYEFHTKTLHQKVCPNHKMVTWKDGQKYVQTMKEFYEEHQRCSSGHRGKFKTTFSSQEGNVTGFTPDELRFLVAYQADGTYYKHGDEFNARFHFVKKRKVDRLLELLKRLDYPIKITSNKEDTYIFTSAPERLLIKEFPKEWYNLCSDELRIIIDEISHWDGCIGGHNSYYTANKNNAEFIQFAGSASGYRSTLFTRTRTLPSGKLNTEHRINFNNNIMPSIYATYAKTHIEVTKAQENEFKYCPSTSTGMWIARYKNYIFVTGNSGKTFCGSLLGILLCMKYAGITGLVGAQTYTLLRDTTLKQYIEHLDNMGFKQGAHYEYKSSEEILKFANGSEILFRHLQEPNKLKSLNLGFVELEEMSDVPESTFLMLLSRLRQTIKDEWRKDGFKYRLFGHTNPESSKGWIYKYFVENKPDNYRLIQAPTTQNKFLEPDYVESLKEAYDDEYYRINVLGEFGDYTSGLVVKNFTKDNIRELKYIPTLPLHLTWDFNVDPMSCIVAHKTDDKVFYIDEFILENSSTQGTIDAVIKKYPAHKSDIIINGDASGDNRSTQSERSNYVIIKNALQRHYPETNIKFHLRPYNPPIKNRIAAFNAMICNHNHERRILIDPKCEKLLYNIYNLKYKVGTDIVDVPTYSQIKTDNRLKWIMHPFDSASYLVDYYWPIKRELPDKKDVKI